MKHLLSGLVAVILICSAAKGEEVTFSFRGTIHETDGEFSYFTGHPFEITYSFDTATDDADPAAHHFDRSISRPPVETVTCSTATFFPAFSSARPIIAFIAEQQGTSMIRMVIDLRSQVSMISANLST